MKEIILISVVCSVSCLMTVTWAQDRQQGGNYQNPKETPKRTYISGLRYVQNGPTREQADPLYVTVNVRFSRHIGTVGDAVKYIINRSGYHISRGNLDKRGTRLLMSLPLPQVHRHLKSMTLKQALNTLIGQAYVIRLNPISRSISFEVRQKYQAMMAAAIQDFYHRREGLAVRKGASPVKSLQWNSPASKNVKTTKSIRTIRNVKRKPVPVIRKKPRRSKSLRLARRGDVTGHPGHLLDDPGLKKVLRLARKAKRPGYTLPQTLMAIRAANPKAFVDRNLYQLKPGVRLKLPARTHFTLSHDDAEIGLIRQYHEFRKNRVRLLARKSRIVYED